MKPADHARATAAAHGKLAGALAVLPDAGVVAQRLPWQRARRWGAAFHHSRGALEAAGRIHPLLGAAWQAHYVQDEMTHPPGTYGIPERAGLPSDLAVAFSGGPDSFITWRLLGQPPAVFVNFPHDAAAAELQVVRSVNLRFCAEAGRGIQVVDGFPLAELGTGWIPYRNLMLILAVQRLSPNVVLSRIAEWGPDKNPAFFRRVTRLLASSRGGHFQAAADLPKVRIYTPFGHLTKTRLVARYLEEFGRGRGAKDLIGFTRSCYAGGEQFCGECGACWCRWVAFENNGIYERDRYARRPERSIYYQRLHWADFRPGMVPMYLARQREMAGHPR